jgi:hypothetical protein
MTKFLMFFALGGLLFAEQVMAAPAGYACPSELPAASLKVEGVPSGWTTFVGAPLYLSDAAPADGPPERLGILRGEGGKVSKTSWTRKYSLEGRYPEGKWLRCDYGAYGEVSLAKRLPDDVKECIVTGHKGLHAGENKFEITCR